MASYCRECKLIRPRIASDIELASAGFIYAPSSGSNDTVMCPLCNYAVEGWEATDDAWEVHRSKVPQCPFFNSTLAVAAPVKKSVSLEQ